MQNPSLLFFAIVDEDNNCVDEINGTPCSINCNSKLSELLQETVVVKDKDLLPLTGFTYGPFTSQNAQASVEIKSLECQHRPNITGDECNVAKFLSTTRIQFDMEYVNDKDCYVEITFPSVVDLKLTVSNFQVSLSKLLKIVFTCLWFSLRNTPMVLNTTIWRYMKDQCHHRTRS